MKMAIFGIGFLILINSSLIGQHLPESIMTTPVYIEHTTGRGTGFFIQDSTYIYLVTAKHVLIDPNSGKFFANEAGLICYDKDPTIGDKIIFKINLVIVDTLRLIIAKPKEDVLIIRMGTLNKLESGKLLIKYYSGIQKLSKPINLNAIPIEYFTRYEEVFVGDEIYLFGYPTSLGLKKSPQFDYTRPLLRKGIIAGKYDANKTLILDCPAYDGNSGGPVMVVIEKPTRIEYNLVGLVVQFIPYEEEWINKRSQLVITDRFNSGYSVAVSSNKILELLNKLP